MKIEKFARERNIIFVCNFMKLDFIKRFYFVFIIMGLLHLCIPCIHLKFSVCILLILFLNLPEI